MPRPSPTFAAVLVATTLGLVACGDADDRPAAGASTAGGAATAGPSATPPARGGRPATTTPGRPAATTTGGDAAKPGATTSTDRTLSAAGDAATPPPPADWTARCPTSTTSALGCRGVLGRVLAIQSYDPDGDGDLHVIAVGGDVTAPGITVFDVRRSLRPRRDPRKGEYVTGAGPVFRGSLRQRQIQVDVFRVWRPRD